MQSKKDCFWLRNYDVEKKTVKALDGRLEKAPPDDGYDEAFFFFLQDTSMTFEWLCYNTRVNPSVLLAKLTNCWYYPNYEGILNDNDASDLTKFYNKVDSYFNNNKK